MGSDDDRPQKPGFLYNSFLEERIRPFPDITDKPLGLTLEPFLRPMEELDTRLYKRRAPAQKQKPGSAAGDGVSTPGGDDMLEPDDTIADADGAENEDATPMVNNWGVEDLDGDEDAEGDAEEEYGYYDNGDGEEGGEEYGDEDVE
ncbi:hypothetical protein PC116_g28973 [Phytophthora cactorum]|nr:hypothetical protein PC116_g28973 [Phytophthora cactorum]